MKESGFVSAGQNLSNLAKRHEKSKTHTVNYTAYQLLGNVDVACALDEARQRDVARPNHSATRLSKLLFHHIDVTVFLAAQGLAFRGHDESKLSSNRGNFLELMELLGGYSHELRSFLDKEAITYTSHDPQNELIECIFKEVRKEIQKRIEGSQFIAVMMDDTSDTSNVEQSAVSVRLVHNGEVEEHMLGMIDASDDQSADALTEIMLSTLENYKIKPATSGNKLIGQSYDGAPTMSGELNSVQNQIQQHYPAAYYNHCVAHRLSLCASQSAMKIPKVAKFFGTADKLVAFFRSSPKRTRRIGLNLPKPGDTRWLSRDTATSVIDSHYETIGAVLYEISRDQNEKADTQSTARGLGIQMQQVEFVFLLKLYRKIFEQCTPIMTIMQKPMLDAVQLRSMIDDFQRLLNDFNLDRIWEDTIQADPAFPVMRERSGWRGIESGNDGSQESWKDSLKDLALTITTKFSEQLSWRFENLKKFRWMDLIHPTKFSQRRKATANEQRALIAELHQLYPFAVNDGTITENNLSVLYNSSEIALLLQKAVGERDSRLAAKKERQTRLQQTVEEVSKDAEERNRSELMDVEENDTFELEPDVEIDIDSVIEGSPSIQDLLTVIKTAKLKDALPQAMTLLELAATTPLTSVHCERVFSRMKRVVAPARSSMHQRRKEMLVILQVEHKLLRWLARQPFFKDSVVSRFKAYDQRRFDRFSKK